MRNHRYRHWKYCLGNWSYEQFLEWDGGFSCHHGSVRGSYLDFVLCIPLPVTITMTLKVGQQNKRSTHFPRILAYSYLDPYRTCTRRSFVEKNVQVRCGDECFTLGAPQLPLVVLTMMVITSHPIHLFLNAGWFSALICHCPLVFYFTQPDFSALVDQYESRGPFIYAHLSSRSSPLSNPAVPANN